MTMRLKAWSDLAYSHSAPKSSLSLSDSSQVLLPFLMFLKHAEYTLASQFLHLLFLVLEIVFS